MGKFNDVIKRIIYVLEEHEEDLIKAVQAYRKAKKIEHITENVYDYVKKYLKDKKIEHGDTQNSLNMIPNNHSSYHEDENGTDQHNNH